MDLASDRVVCAAPSIHCLGTDFTETEADKWTSSYHAEDTCAVLPAKDLIIFDNYKMKYSSSCLLKADFFVLKTHIGVITGERDLIHSSILLLTDV